jgi:hypothetical protein
VLAACIALWMTAERLRMHSHSEAVLHRWDFVGDDDISIRLLSIRQWLTTRLRRSMPCPG